MPLQIGGPNVGGVNAMQQPGPSFGQALSQSWSNTFAKSTFWGVMRVLANITVIGALVDLVASGIAHWRGTLGQNAHPAQPANVIANLVEEPPVMLEAPPKITTKKELFDFVRLLGKAGQAGHAVENGSTMRVNPDTGIAEQNTLYTYGGLVFRGDSRPPEEIMKSGGFKSKNDLSIPENVLEAQGLALGIGATGQSGVSCSKNLDGVVNYCTKDEKGYVYFVDTSKLGETERAYDMADISMKNGHKQTDETGGEVNITSIPPEAIIGWIIIPNAGTILDEGGDVTRKVLNGLTLGQVHMNPLYGAEV